MEIGNLIKKLRLEMKLGDDTKEAEFNYRMLYRTLKQLDLDNEYFIDYKEVNKMNKINIYSVFNEDDDRFLAFKNFDFVNCNINLIDGPYDSINVEIIKGNIVDVLDIYWVSEYLEMSVRMGKMESIDVKDIILHVDEYLKRFEPFKSNTVSIRYNVVNEDIISIFNIDSIDIDYKYFDIKYCDN